MIKDYYAVIIQTRWRAHKAFDDYQRLLIRIQQCSYHVQHCNMEEYVIEHGMYWCDMCMTDIRDSGYGCRECDIDMCDRCFKMCNANHIS